MLRHCWTVVVWTVSVTPAWLVVGHRAFGGRMAAPRTNRWAALTGAPSRG